MASITTRVGKGSPLTTQELDANFTNLNTDKLEKSGESAAFADLSLQSATATLHRSPNAITALFVYDTSKDSDGGAWTEKCQHTSWYNETIYGRWLGAQASEAAARAVSGATTDDYYQLTTDGKFYKLNAGSGTTEVFRGNRRSFPKLAALVGESQSITIYDLTEPGRPMWMRFWRNPVQNNQYLQSLSVGVDVNGLVGVSGQIITSFGDGVMAIRFARDDALLWDNYGHTVNVGKPISERQSNKGARNILSFSDSMRASFAPPTGVAATVLNGAPVDPVTGLKIPTIAASHQKGVSVVQHSGTVRNSSSTSAFTQVTLTPQLLSAGRADAVWYTAANPGSLGSSFALTTKAASTATDFNVGTTSLLRAKDRGNYARSSGTLVNLLRNNESTIGKGLAAKLSDAYNAGWLVGDIRRAYLANSSTADRSYKAATATANGTITSAAVATNADLVAYSGFSAANYLREPYSADLDFGTGEWSASAWVNVPIVLPAANYPTTGSELVTNGDFSNGSTGWALGSGFSVVDGQLIGTNVTLSLLATSSALLTVGKYYRVRANVVCTGGSFSLNIGTSAGTATGTGTYAYDYLIRASSTNVSIQQRGSTFTGTIDNVSIFEVNPALIFDRAYSIGPRLALGVGPTGDLYATAYDGTTTRTVTTTAAYNTATWLKARANYTTDGKLAILVNGVEVASTTGTPLLTLNNSDAVLTIGNSYALDAPFPGSIALLKLSATVPTAEQALFAYEQEKHLFREGAKCVLPASTNVLDLAYDDATDTWSALQATHESTWSGLVRTATATPSAGSFSRLAASSGIELLARTTTNPGVDVKMPAKNLRPKDMPKDVNQDITVFDFDAVTSQTDFVLPVDYTARVVYSAGAQKREGSTKDWTRLYDGFRETIRFGTAPGNTVWVQIHAVKEVSL